MSHESEIESIVGGHRHGGAPDWRRRMGGRLCRAQAAQGRGPGADQGLQGIQGREDRLYAARHRIQLLHRDRRGHQGRRGKRGIETFMLAPQNGDDINGQMGMIQDVINQKVAAIILSTHDEHAAAPLVKQAVAQGIAVVIVNSDIQDFPAPVHAVVGYSQRNGTHKEGDYALKLVGDKAMAVGILEGQPGYHSTERVGGFLDAIKGSKLKVVASLDGKWNVEGGNAAAMDMLQAHPEINMIFAANDYEIMGAAQAAKALGRKDLADVRQRRRHRRRARADRSRQCHRDRRHDPVRHGADRARGHRRRARQQVQRWIG